MYLSSSLVIRALLALSIVAGLAHAYPADDSRVAPRADPRCDHISKYTVDFFKQNACKKPHYHLHCIFYTEDQGHNARTWAGHLGSEVMTIWGFMEEEYYDESPDPEQNPRACIFKDRTKNGLRNQYFKHMSEAYAYFCTKIALLMTPNADRIPPEGIWAMTEFPTLMRTGNAGQVNVIDAYYPDETYQKNIYTRPGTQFAETNIDYKNASSFEAAGTCGAPPGREKVFDKGGKWPINW